MYLGDVKKIVHETIEEIGAIERQMLEPGPSMHDKLESAGFHLRELKRKLVPIVCEHPANMAVPQNSPGETITVKCGECGHEGELEYKYDDIDWR